MNTDSPEILYKSRFVSILKKWLSRLRLFSRETGPSVKTEAIDSNNPTDIELPPTCVDYTRPAAWFSRTASAAATESVQKRMFSLSELLTKIETHYSTVATSKGLGFSMSIDREIDGLFQGDPVKIVQVLGGVIGCAINATDAGELSVTCLYRNRYLKSSVSDTGIELSQQQVESINSSNSLKQQSQPIPDQSTIDPQWSTIMSACNFIGGRITVKSENAVGSVLTVTLPLERNPSSPVAIAEEVKTLSRWQRKYADIPGMKNVLVRGLERLQHEFDELVELLDNNNSSKAAELLHRMKSFPGGFGLTDLYANICKVEQLAGQENDHKEHQMRLISELKEQVFAISQHVSQIADPPAPSSVESGLNESTNKQRHGRVLVADDDRLNCDMIGYLLNQLQLDYAVVHEGEAVLNLLQTERFDLLLLDIRMPVMGGVETMQRIREQSALSDLFIIVMTANVNPNDEIRLNTLGCNEFVAKPIDLDNLTAKIKKAMT